jgi:hypothetical protein
MVAIEAPCRQNLIALCCQHNELATLGAIKVRGRMLRISRSGRDRVVGADGSHQVAVVASLHLSL